jgi:hypothetical protein
MRLLLIAAVAAFMTSGSSAAPDRGVAPADPPTRFAAAAEDAVMPHYGNRCPSETARIAKVTRARPEFHKLTDLPDANAYSAVFRSDENGCPDPIVIRYEVGKSRR